jgi:hypothetical protein
MLLIKYLILFIMFNITCISNNEQGISEFNEITFQKTDRKGMLLSERIDAQNFRLRESLPGYRSDWHLSGDPTLIIIQNGILRISLQNGNYKDFKSGEMFIAADNLPENMVFDPKIHGHRAEVIGDESLLAVHIKLEGFIFH